MITKKTTKWGILLLIGLASMLFYKLFFPKSFNISFKEEVKRSVTPLLDSMQMRINLTNEMHRNINKYINTGEYQKALDIMDSASLSSNNPVRHIYQGMIYEKKGEIERAINEYTLSISEEGASLALRRRGELYMRLEKFDSALCDFKKGYFYNYDYSIDIAKAFEKQKKNDSALKYYKVFLGHYPRDTFVVNKIKQL